ncbi:MAG TPA: hypothetical protein VGK32_07480 [Vicinamibacterales bacterium]
MLAHDRNWIVVALAASALIVGGTNRLAARQDNAMGHETARPAAATARSAIDHAQLRQDMRKLWSDHAIWTREYIVAAVDGTPDAQAAATRLLRNQDDIGRAIASFYGDAAGEKLTGLLKQHILIAVDLVAAAKAGDHAKSAAADRAWTANGEQIADFLSRANPNWPRAAVADMMAMHLATTTKEVVARLNKKWDDDVQAFDEVYSHLMKMADVLTDGIVKQFAAGA